MSGFDDYGITHLSASSLNMAAAQLPAWVAERLLNRKIPVGAAAHRGTSIEAGVTEGLLHPDMPLAECQDIALRRYDGLTALSSSHVL